MIVALAGRRIDPASDGEPRFPLSNAPVVRARLAERFQHERPAALVCSAACGADLLALDVAGAMAVRRRVVLPFHRDRFRLTSVTDRPGDWGPLFDRTMDEVEQRGDLVVLGLDPVAADAAYRAATERLLDEAARLTGSGGQGSGTSSEAAKPAGLIAVVVWDGKAGPGIDQTADFVAESHRRLIPVVMVPTL